MTVSRDGLALLGLRLVLGAASIAHGAASFSHVFGWTDAWAVARIVAGCALLLGAFTRIAAFLIAVEMAIAIFFSLVPHGAPFVSPPGRVNFELPLTDLALGFALVVLGAGPLSIDGRRSGGVRPPPPRGARGRR